jgi:hypothetical protein
MQLVELEILKISYLGNFSSCYIFLKVILKNSLKSKVGGKSYSCRRIKAGQRTAWAPASHCGLWPASRRAYDCHLVRARLPASSAGPETPLKGRAPSSFFFFFFSAFAIAAA